MSDFPAPLPVDQASETIASPPRTNVAAYIERDEPGRADLAEGDTGDGDWIRRSRELRGRLYPTSEERNTGFTVIRLCRNPLPWDMFTCDNVLYHTLSTPKTRFLSALSGV
ncbi:MAG: hypothetical protein M3Y72_18005 [Acidobacteriota bacterium]|nr:hypothetical protein [Acidobacteriota bacterium]